MSGACLVRKNHPVLRCTKSQTVVTVVVSIVTLSLSIPALALSILGTNGNVLLRGTTRGRGGDLLGRLPRW
jgi:hypothetical protein